MLRGVDFSLRFARRALDAGHAVYAARALSYQPWLQRMLGASEERANAIDELCERLCAESGDLNARSVLLYTRTVCAYLWDAPEQCTFKFEETLRFLREHPTPVGAYFGPWAHWYRLLLLEQSGRIAEAGEQALAHMAEARARGDRVATFMYATNAVRALLAADRSEEAQHLAEHRLHPHGEPVLQDAVWLMNRYFVVCYRRSARQLWYEDAPERERLLSSFLFRVIFPGWAAAASSGLAAQAAREATDDAERRRLRSAALRLAKQGARDLPPWYARILAPLAGRIACLKGDREGAIAALRAHLALGLHRLSEHLTRRKLGELLRDAEGEALIASADEALRAGGVVDPARFASALYAGIEID